VLQPAAIPGLSVVLDYVNIHVDGPISQLTLENILSACYDTPGGDQNFCKLFHRDANAQITTATTGYFNAGFEDFRGETVTVAYGFPVGEVFGNSSTDFGRLDFEVNATHTDLLQVALVGPTITREDGTIAQPIWKGRFDAHYRIGAWRLNYSLDYLSATRNTEPFYIPVEFNGHVIDHVGANYTSNVSVLYDITDRITARLGVNNVFDRGPSWPTTTYGDIIGRTWFAGINARF
jgi:hypothetical protein